MCTVTYIPQPGNNFILTSNRDENAARSPQNLTHFAQAGKELIFPRDTVAGGTWIAASEDNRAVCLLNGAFEKHHHRPPYKRSRGMMVLDFFTYPSAPAFFETYDFEGMEPFTFLMVDQGDLYELRWNEKNIHARQMDNKGYYIWSSATLYPKEIREQRQSWFSEWLSGREDFSVEAIQQFHRSGGEGDDWNGFIMNRNGRVQTVSITNIVKKDDNIELIYNDLLRENIKREKVKLKAATLS
ncbi:MAG: NRDE family protein [Lewinellaceae bacterium]|nr:NRDE family protein [Saprospiraceae bacterium]MCB9337938.1 NRDE family protein [Lewinellaceae bacterium]